MKYLREPLVHFLAIGAGLFLLFGALGDSRDDIDGSVSDRIVVTEGDIERLAETWARTWRRPPTMDELDGLIEDHVIEEILYREALAMGLDEDDTIIRRRLRQKMEFLVEDVALQVPPTDEQLLGFLEANADAYRMGGLTSFDHVYINRDRRGESAVPYAEEILEQLVRGEGDIDVVEASDFFLLPNEFETIPERELESLFGPRFASELAGLPEGEWKGPVESGYGLHLVLVRERMGGRTPPLEEVRDEVLRDWEAANLERTNDEILARLQDKYSIVIERPEWADREEVIAGAGE